MKNLINKYIITVGFESKDDFITRKISNIDSWEFRGERGLETEVWLYTKIKHRGDSLVAIFRDFKSFEIEEKPISEESNGQ